MSQAVLCSLFRHLRSRFQAGADRYVVLDLETTGFSRDRDLIVQVGLGHVRPGQDPEFEDYYLNWTEHPEVGCMHERIARCRQNIEEKDGRLTGKKCHLTYEKVQGGRDVEESLTGLRDLLEELRRDRVFLLTHNGIGFDMEFLDNHFRWILGVPYPIGAGDVVDTGMIEIAIQKNIPLLPGETLLAWSKRVRKAGHGKTKWSLTGHCADRYDLWAAVGCRREEAHDALVDCRLTQALFQHYCRQESAL